MAKKNKKLLAILAIIVANVIWGITPVFNKIGLEQFSPMWFFVIRYSLATLLFLFIFRHRGKKIKPRDHLTIAISAWIGISLTIVTMYYGLRITRGLDASVIGSLGPVMLFWLSILFLKERFRWQPFIGTVIALGGSLAVMVGPVLASGSEGKTYVFGGLLVLTSIFLDQVGAILTKPLLKKYDLSKLALWRLIYAVVPVLLLALVLEPAPAFTFHTRTIVSLFYLVFFGIVIAFPLYYYGTKRLDVEDFSVLFYVDPVFGVLSSMLILGERPGISFAVGVVCIIVGILIAELHIKKRFKFVHWHLRHK